jgi:hypothetical protein
VSLTETMNAAGEGRRVDFFVRLKPQAELLIGQQQKISEDTKQNQVIEFRKDYAVVDREELSLRSAGNVEEQQRGVISRQRRGSAKRAPQTTVERFWLLNRWRGQVLRVENDTFEAQLTDPTNPSIIETAVFSKSELGPESALLLRAGAVFYWMVGYRDLRTRQRLRESVIFMRRGGRIEKSRFEKALNDVRKIWGAIDDRAEKPAKPERD